MSYIHFTEKELYSIEFYLNEWIKPYKIAYKLNRNQTSVYRLLENYSKPDWTFDALYCIQQKKLVKSYNNSKNKTKKISKKLETYILDKIKSYWSPEQISWRIKHIPKELGTWEYIWKDAIYKFIYTNYPELVKKYFRRKGKKYISHRWNKYQIMDRVMIDKRPDIVDKRERIWDWEWDTIVWKRWVSKECLLTNVERKTWYLLCSKIPDKSGNSVLEATIKLFKNIPPNKKLTETYDNGREFAEHWLISYYTWMDIYFARPYHSWERWTNENTNWLIRQFFPKWTDFSKVDDNSLKKVINLINNRPRKRLWFKTPYECFFSS